MATGATFSVAAAPARGLARLCLRLLDRLLERAASTVTISHCASGTPRDAREPGLNPLRHRLGGRQQTAAHLDDHVVHARQVLLLPVCYRPPLGLDHGDVLQRERLDARIAEVALRHTVDVVVVVDVVSRLPRPGRRAG